MFQRTEGLAVFIRVLEAASVLLDTLDNTSRHLLYRYVGSDDNRDKLTQTLDELRRTLKEVLCRLRSNERWNVQPAGTYQTNTTPFRVTPCWNDSEQLLGRWSRERNSVEQTIYIYDQLLHRLHHTLQYARKFTFPRQRHHR